MKVLESERPLVGPFAEWARNYKEPEFTSLLEAIREELREAWKRRLRSWEFLIAFLGVTRG